MSRSEPMRIELVDDVQVVIGIEFVGRQDAVFVAGFEERNRDHQSMGELEGVVLGEDEVVRHFEGLHRERPIPARWLPRRTGIGRDHRESEAAAAARWRSRPRSGLIGEDPDRSRTPSHEERDWAVPTGSPLEQHEDKD